MVVWTVIPPAVMSKSFADGRWSESRQIDLDGRGVQAPAFSTDGRYLYYQAVRDGGDGGLDIWRVKHTSDGWGTPVSVGSEVNTDQLESQPSLSAEGVLYFTGTLEGVGFNRGIYRSFLIKGEYGPPELLGDGINSEYIDYCPWIAADESFLLFASSRPETAEHLHLHVSYRQRNGRWSEPVNIHPALKFEGEARFPSVSPDGRFLFFSSGNEAYWVDITPVMELRPGDEDSRPERNNRPS